MKFDVITFGAATYDTFVRSDEFKLQKTQDGVMLCEGYGKKINLTECLTTSGGGATNAAVCFERMGLQTGLVACLGRDHYGREIKEQLTAEGVSLAHIQQTDRKPTSSSIILVGNDGGRTILVHRAASNLLSWHQVDWSRLDANWLYVSSIGGDFTLLSKIVRLSQDKQIHLAFNPGGSELSQTEKLHRYLPFIEVLILNKQEALQCLGQEPTQSLDVKKLIALGAHFTIVTDGKAGATLYQPHEVSLHQARIKVKAVEETGAGDAFGAGFVASQLRGLSLEQSLAIAAHNAASVVLQVGGKAGLLFWPEVREKLKF